MPWLHAPLPLVSSIETGCIGIGASRHRPKQSPDPPTCALAVLDGLKYAKSHEWAKVEGDVATVGISDHAQVGLQSWPFVRRGSGWAPGWDTR